MWEVLINWLIISLSITRINALLTGVSLSIATALLKYIMSFFFVKVFTELIKKYSVFITVLLARWNVDENLTSSYFMLMIGP